MRGRPNVEMRQMARELRSHGKTYAEIMENLGVTLPKSTISVWCQGVSLPTWYQAKINVLNKKNLSEGQRVAWAANKLKRERFLKELWRQSEKIVAKSQDRDILKMLLAMLYLGEGTKWRSHRGLMLGSSDPGIIRLYIRLLEICYGLRRGNLKCRVSYRADQDLQALERYWSKVTGIPLGNFYKTIPDPRTIGKPTKRKEYKGVCVVMSGGTHVQLELEMIPKLILKGL